MKKTVTAVCLALIVLTFVFMFVYCTFFPREELSDYVNLKEKPVFSLESLFSGEYFNGMSQYFTDTVHGRDRFIDYEARIRSLYGVTENETVHRVDGSAETHQARMLHPPCPAARKAAGIWIFPTTVTPGRTTAARYPMTPAKPPRTSRVPRFPVRYSLSAPAGWSFSAGTMRRLSASLRL